ncbi:hypothetical protein Hypma_003204 [Hypsizygus marmoreus]|uniref:Uncharacterized protein n=1 Tax=Hypsizygus marmoreus TaxID=39966 RepID=A0A369K4R4_HYPMA|nr:hypothetical protein Hypma_003204 [Hypsizygus marmoreus]
MAQTLNTNAKQKSYISSAFQTVSNYFKPHRAEAIQRIRINAFCFLLVLIFSNLLPLPSIQSAVRVVSSSSRPERWSSDWVYRWFCIAEASAAAIFSFNVLEGVHAVRYPRPPLPPYSSPAKTKPIFKAATPSRPFRIMSPNTSPQPQRPFAFSPSASFSASTSKYQTSPLSTPSRVLQYSTIPASSTNTQASSTSTMAFLSTPSPVISAYRGKYSGGVGRALDESLLCHLPSGDADDDE